MGRVGLKFFLKSSEETIAFGKSMGASLPKNALLALTGDLGAGKTTFVQGLALGLGIQEPIQSPTFVILNVYMGLFHFDLYRLKKEEEFIQLGFEEYFHAPGISVIEWPDRIQKILPTHTIHISFMHEENGRAATVVRP
jgi:tRNA threonylcarbamoyladenosine biosynthesis protein TsaE